MSDKKTTAYGDWRTTPIFDAARRREYRNGDLADDVEKHRQHTWKWWEEREPSFMRREFANFLRYAHDAERAAAPVVVRGRVVSPRKESASAFLANFARDHDTSRKPWFRRMIASTYGGV